MFKNLFCLYKNLNLESILFITCVAIDFPERVSSRMQPKYVTFECCLTFYLYSKYLKDFLFKPYI